MAERNPPAEAGHNPRCSTSKHPKSGTIYANPLILPGIIVPHHMGEWYCFLPFSRVFAMFLYQKGFFSRPHLVNYIITACKNNARNYIKYKNRHPEVSIDEWIDTPNVLGDRTEIEGKIIDLDEKQSLISIWSQLDPTSQFILESYYIWLNHKTCGIWGCGHSPSGWHRIA